MSSFDSISRRNPECQFLVPKYGELPKPAHRERGKYGTVHLAVDGAEGLQSQRFSTILRRSRDGGRIRPNRRCTGRFGFREERQAGGGLDALSGVHLL